MNLVSYEAVGKFSEWMLFIEWEGLKYWPATDRKVHYLFQFEVDRSFELLGQNGERFAAVVLAISRRDKNRI